MPVHHVEEFAEEVAPGPVAGARRTHRFIGRVKLAPRYKAGGDEVALPVEDATLVAVIVTPEFDGERFVVWNGSRADPRLRVLWPSGAEVDEGTLHAGLVRVVEVVLTR